MYDSRRGSLRKPNKSLRTTLMFWFLVFSLLPLSLITGYFLQVYESTIDNEIKERLKGNSRELALQISEISKDLTVAGRTHASDPTVAFYLSASHNSLQKLSAQRLNGRNVQRVAYVTRSGKYVASSQLQGEQVQTDFHIEEKNLYWDEKFLAEAKKSDQLQLFEPNPKGVLDLVVVSRVKDRRGELVGFVEEAHSISQVGLETQGRRMNLELVALDSQGHIVVGSHPDFALMERGTFAGKFNLGEKAYQSLNLRDSPYGFLMTPISWGAQSFYFAVGTSKSASIAFQRRVVMVLLSIVSLMFITVIASTWYVSSQLIVRPLKMLLDATQSLDQKDRPLEIPIKSEDEIGVLTDSFNEMSQRIFQAQSELKSKINELQAAYVELKETQARLVHSAKMASLGQLVAGVAHELNNPIGFIYSNMNHLKDYSDKLMSLIKVAEEHPQSLEKLKQDVEYNYIIEDLPRLIRSCEEGARRTRDIVIGLRNFSRLEEAKVKKINLKEDIENTLQLLSGDIKNRISVETKIENIPEILCYPSQLNQVFMNILSNAVQAINGDGVIQIVAELKKRKGREFVHVSIKDNGKGIPPEHLEKIFDPFFTTKAVGQGTGLGLSISYGIIKKHGGDILVKSEVGKGTEFVIVLPVDGPQDVAI